MTMTSLFSDTRLLILALVVVSLGFALSVSALFLFVWRNGKRPHVPAVSEIPDSGSGWSRFSRITPGYPHIRPARDGNEEEMKAVQQRYEGMLKEVSEQLHLIIGRKSEDICLLRGIQQQLGDAAVLSRQISTAAMAREWPGIVSDSVSAGPSFPESAPEAIAEWAIRIESNLRIVDDRIDECIRTLDEAMYVETQFVQATNILMKDLVLSVVRSFYQLSRMKAHDESIVATLQVPLLVIDSNLRILSVSDAYCRLFDTTPDATIGQLIYAAGNRQWNIIELRNRLEKTLSTRESFFDFEVSRSFEGTGPRIMSLSGRRLSTPEDQDDMLLLSITDITERRQAEYRLAETMTVLSQKNNELEQKNAELDEFAFIASHDLQEPLRKIITFADLLQTASNQTLPESASNYLAAITRASTRMQNLIQALLDLSRSGRKSLQSDLLALDDCLDQAMEALETGIRQTGARIHRDELPNVKGDRIMLTQLYQNLIGNALRFRSVENPEIRITCENTPDGPILGVWDNGIGIKPEFAELIFAPFKRLHGRDQYEGTGIGLAICRKVVERHGGTIWVEAASGQGSHFRFTLQQTGRIKDEDKGKRIKAEGEPA